MEPGTLAQWGSALAGWTALAISVWTAVSKSRDAKVVNVAKSLDAQKDRLDRHERRIASMEADMRHLPDHRTFNQLQLDMSELKGQLAVVVERVGPIKAIAERLQEVMLERDR